MTTHTVSISEGIKKQLSYLKKERKKRLKNEHQVLTSHLQEATQLAMVKKPDPGERARIIYLKERIQYRTGLIKDIEKDNTQLNIQDTIRDFNKLKKHPHIIGIEADKTRLLIYTKPLKVLKRNIGHFEISLSVIDLQHIYISNLKIKRTHDGESIDHWFIKGNIPCLGNWSEGLHKYMLSGNFYLVVETILQFLTSGQRSHAGYITFKQFVR